MSHSQIDHLTNHIGNLFDTVEKNITFKKAFKFHDLESGQLSTNFLYTSNNNPNGKYIHINESSKLPQNVFIQVYITSLSLLGIFFVFKLLDKKN